MTLRGRWVGMIGWLTLLLVSMTVTVAAQGPVSVRLEPVSGSAVSGVATLTAQGEGTLVTLEVTGLAAGTAARATMQAGTCAAPSASFAELPALTADASGQATASGKVLFRGTGDVALATMADGAHIIAVAGPSGVVACGAIPRLTAGSGTTLPATGGATPWLVSGLLAGVGLLAVGGGMWAWTRRRSRSA